MTNEPKGPRHYHCTCGFVGTLVELHSHKCCVNATHKDLSDLVEIIGQALDNIRAGLAECSKCVLLIGQIVLAHTVDPGNSRKLKSTLDELLKVTKEGGVRE